jgi:hypothetical protein
MITFDSKLFKKDMQSIIDYSIGFLEGVQGGKKVFLMTLGQETKEILEEYIDSMARVDPAMLHHVYEWQATGSPDARLYDIIYTVSGIGLSFKSTFKQSTSIKDGSKVPFYDKARIIENGIPVVIKPKTSQVLAFDDNGEEVFTKQPISIANPGGTEAEGGFERAFDTFFSRYFSQAFLRASGVAAYLEKPTTYKSNLASGKRYGKSKGYQTGYRWVANAGIGR